MNKPGLKVSGLIQSGRVAPAQGIATSTAFDPAATVQAAAPQTGRETMVGVNLLDDSPYQTRKKIDPIRVNEIGQSLQAGGQSTPLTVRVVSPGRYEIIKGHTRKRAAISLGWEELRVLVVERDDRQARLDVMLDNEGTPLSEYEYGHMFREAMTLGYAKTQGELAQLFACSQSKVSKCLNMLELPSPVRALLDDAPGLFGAKAAAEILTLWKENPTNTDVVLQGVKRLFDGAEQNLIRAWVTQQLTRGKGTGSDRPKNHVIPSASGTPCYVTMAKNRDITVRLADAALDPVVVREKIEALLRELAASSV